MSEPRILSICPAPAGLLAVYRFSDQDQEHREPVVAFGVVEDKSGGINIRYAAALVVDAECGSLEVADDGASFHRLEWVQPTKGCQCSAA